jgi:hypothetical protein
MRLARTGILASTELAYWQWTYRDGTCAIIEIGGGRDQIVLTYRYKSYGRDWETVEQCVPIRWTPCRFGGQRPWFICAVHANGTYCGRNVAKLYGGGRLFACRHCYRLGYAVQRIDSPGQAHHNLERLHRKLDARYEQPDMPTPPKPKWMRWNTYNRIAHQIEVGQERLDDVFLAGAQRLLARVEKFEHRRRPRR